MAWLTGYTYRKSHSVSASTYQSRIIVHRGTGTDSGLNVYLSSHCAAWPNDIRFTTSDQTTLINYWIQSSDANTAYIWLASSPASMYIYYGKEADSSPSSGANTFSLYDDFNDSSINTTLWNTSGSVTEASGTARVGSAALLYSKTTFSSSSAAGFSSYQGTASMVFNAGFSSSNRGTQSIIYGSTQPAHRGENRVSPDSSATANFSTMDKTSAHFYEVKRGSTFVCDGEALSDGNYVPSGSLPLLFYANNYYYVDFAFVRSWNGSEPSHGVWGSEEGGAVARRSTMMLMGI